MYMYIEVYCLYVIVSIKTTYGHKPFKDLQFQGTSVVVSTDLLDKDPNRQVSVDKVVTSGSLSQWPRMQKMLTLIEMAGSSEQCFIYCHFRCSISHFHDPYDTIFANLTMITLINLLHWFLNKMTPVCFLFANQHHSEVWVTWQWRRWSPLSHVTVT